MALTLASSMTITFEGIVQNNALIFRHIFPNEAQLVGYRILSRVSPNAVPININVSNNGVVLGSMVLNTNSTDTGEQSLPNIYFYTGDQLEIVFSNVGPVPLEGQSLIIEVDVENGDRIPGSQSFNRIATPLLPRYEGILQLNDTFYKKTFSDDILIYNCRILLRVAADKNVIVSVQQNGVEQTQVTLLAGMTDSGNFPVSVSLENGDEVELQIVQIGSFGTEGQDLTFILDYSNLSQNTFVDFQVPFVISSDAIYQNSLIFRYNLPRTVTFVFGTCSVRNVSTSPVAIGIYKNGALQKTLVIPAGASQSTVSQFAIQYNLGDQLEIIPVSDDNISAGLTVVLDNTVNPAAPDFSSFNFYSDPQSDIILMMRTVGVGSGTADILRPSDLVTYQAQADQLINATLSSLYRCPLQKINRPFQTSPWPVPLQITAQRLVMRNVINDTYSVSEPNASNNSPNNEKLAYETLTQIVSKQIILDGQRLRARNYGSNPMTENLTSPVQATQS